MNNLKFSLLILLLSNNFLLSAQTISSIALIGNAENSKNWLFPSEVNPLQADILIDKENNILYLDNVNHQVKKINRLTGDKSIVAGTGTAGFSGDGGPAINAQLAYPISLAIDHIGNIYITDRDNHRIRKIDQATKIISTFAGNGIGAFSGDGGLAKNASLFFPFGICVDTNNNVLLIADSYNSVIRRVNMSTNIIQTIAGQARSAGFAGDGSSAVWSSRLNLPSEIEVDKLGNIYIVDLGNLRIRKITAATGIINTIAGGAASKYDLDSVSALSAYIADPLSITLDKNNNLYISELRHNRIRKLDVTTNKLYHITGKSAAGGYSGDGGFAKDASIKFPSGLCYDFSNDEILFADNHNSRIRLISNAPPSPFGDSLQEVCRFIESTNPNAIGSNLLWYNKAIGGTGSFVKPIINTSMPDTFTYFVSQNIAGKESIRKAIVVSVVNYDSAYFYVPVFEICNKSESFKALQHFVPIDFSKYVHFSTSPIFSDTFASDPSKLLYTGKFTLYAKTISKKGCHSPSFSSDIIIREQTPIPVFDPLINICQWGPRFTPNANGTNLLWYLDTMLGGYKTSPKLTTEEVKTVYLYVTQTDSSHCTSNIGIMQINVNPKPKETVLVKSPVEYCQDENADTFSASGTNLTWYSEDFVLLGRKALKPSTKEPGKSKTFVCVQNEFGCNGFFSEIITIVKPKPTISSTVIIIKPYTGLPIELNCSSDIGKTYHWNTGDNVSKIIFTPKNEGRYYFWVQSSSELGCKSDTSWHYVDILPSEYWNSDFEVHPNPFKSNIRLTNINLQDIRSVNLYNLYGMRVFQSELPLKSLDIYIPDKLGSGYYLLEINTVGHAHPTRLLFKE